MVIKRFYIALGLFYTLCYLTTTLTTTPYISPNPIYSSAGTYIFDTSPYYTTTNSTLNPLSFNIAFTRAHSSTNYSFGYSINRITYTITNNQVNYTLEIGAKAASYVTLKFYTNNANQISNLAISYIIIQPLFNIYDFQFCWIRPNSNIINGQNFQASLPGVGPYTSTTQKIWTTIVGVDASLSSNNQIDLYAMAWLTTTTNIQFRISTISPTSFYLTSVIIEVFMFNQTLLLGELRTARFTAGERDKNTGLSYTNIAMNSYNTIYGFRTYHTVNQNYLNFQWTLTSGTLSVTTTNTFSWVAFNYLILEFITCAVSTPYLMLSNSTCYDTCPIRYYADQYNQCQICPYDCYYCYGNNSCSSCSNSTDYRYFNTSNYRCVPLDGYYDDGVNSQAIPCNASNCKTCTSQVTCLTCFTKTYLAANSTCQSCMANCQNCTLANNCFNCSTYYIYQNGSCIVDCSNYSNCSSCSLINQTVICSSCVLGYNVTNNTCLQICGNSIRTQSQQCDDGNSNNGDGCNSICQIEMNYYCDISVNPNICSSCSNNCTNCTISACIACESNFTLANGTCTTTVSNATVNNTETSNTTNTTTVSNATVNNSSIININPTANTSSTIRINLVVSSCGNGVIQLNQGCDDGNTINNDGCNSQCQVQTYFSCSSSSICNLNTLTSSIVSITKNPTSNDFSVSVRLQPSSLQVYKTLSWQSIIYQKSTLNIKMANAYYDSSLNTLVVSYSYFDNLNGNQLIIGYNFTNSTPFSLLGNITTKATLEGQTNNLSLQYYQTQTYKLSIILSYASFTISTIAFIVFIIGFYKGKIIALQLITIFQITYLSLISMDKLSPVFYSLNGLSLSCGFALNLTGSKSSINRYAPVSLKPIFLDNYNINFIFVLLPLTISIILSIVAKVKQLDDTSRISLLAMKMRTQWVFYGLMFSLYICFISLGLSFMDLSMSSLQLSGLILDAFLIIAALLLSLKLLSKKQEMGQFQSSFTQQKCLSQNFYLLLVLQRLLTSVFLLLFTVSMQILIVLIILQMGLVIFVRPYTITGQNLRPLLNLGITLLIQLLFFLTPYLTVRLYKQYAPFAIFALLVLSLIYNIYYLIKFILEVKKKQLKDIKNDMQVNQSKLLNSQRMKLDLNTTFLNQTIIRPQQEINLEISSAVWSIRQRLNKIKQMNIQQHPTQRIENEQIILIENHDDLQAL